MSRVHLREVVLFSTTLIAIVNPISSAVLFASMSGRFGPAIQTRMANQSAFAVLVILFICAWGGRIVLNVLGINVPMLQAAGGLILLQYGMRMVTVEELKLTPAEQVSADEVGEEHWKTLAIVPLAIPGTAGTITTVVVQATTFKDLRDLTLISVVCSLTALIMWFTFRSAGLIARRLGPIGLNVVTRVMGILVAATGFGLLGRGIGGLLPGLAH
jgi:multiple antibiotic resistance protein